MKFPSADHPIDLKRYPGLVTAFVGDIVLAESQWVLVLREAAYAPVFYFPTDSVAMTLLEPSARAGHCPYKGDVGYFSTPQLGEDYADVAWHYEAPYPAMADVRGHVAFGERVTIELAPVLLP